MQILNQQLQYISKLVLNALKDYWLLRLIKIIASCSNAFKSTNSFKCVVAIERLSMLLCDDGRSTFFKYQFPMVISGSLEETLCHLYEFFIDWFYNVLSQRHFIIINVPLSQFKKEIFYSIVWLADIWGNWRISFTARHTITRSNVSTFFCVEARNYTNRSLFYTELVFSSSTRARPRYTLFGVCFHFFC